MHAPQRGCTAIWDTDMYAPTVSRGSRHNAQLQSDLLNTLTLPATTATVDADASSASSEAVGDDLKGNSVSCESNPPSWKSFTVRNTDHSNLPHNTHCPHKIPFIFPFRDIDRAPHQYVTAMSSGGEALSHDVISLSDVSCRAYPPGSAVTPAVPSTQSSHLHADRIIDSNHDYNGSNGIAYRTALSGHMGGGINSVYTVPCAAPSGHLRPVDNGISHVVVSANGQGKAVQQDLTSLKGPILPMGGVEDKGANGAATVPLESADPKSLPATTSYFSWLF